MQVWSTRKLRFTGQQTVLTRIRCLQHAHLMPVSTWVSISKSMWIEFLLIAAQVPLQSFHRAANIPVKYYPRRSSSFPTSHFFNWFACCNSRWRPGSFAHPSYFLDAVTDHSRGGWLGSYWVDWQWQWWEPLQPQQCGHVWLCRWVEGDCR